MEVPLNHNPRVGIGLISNNPEVATISVYSSNPEPAFESCAFSKFEAAFEFCATGTFSSSFMPSSAGVDTCTASTMVVSHSWAYDKYLQKGTPILGKSSMISGLGRVSDSFIVTRPFPR